MGEYYQMGMRNECSRAQLPQIKSFEGTFVVLINLGRMILYFSPILLIFNFNFDFIYFYMFSSNYSIHLYPFMIFEFVDMHLIRYGMNTPH